MKKVIAVDLDGTLAHYDGWKGLHHIGSPIESMVQRVHNWIEEGHKVVIFTARAINRDEEQPVIQWLERLGLGHLEITNVKRKEFVEIWDDRAVRVVANTGERCCESN